MAAPGPKPAADISRLRIERGDGPVGRRLGGPSPLWLVVLLLLAGTGWLMRDRFFGSGAPSAGAGRAVKTGLARKLVPGAVREGDVAANGYVVADRQASLASVISGRLVELNAQEGDIVEAGAVVARVQSDDLEAQEQEARERLASAQAQVAQAHAAVAAAQLELPRLDSDRRVLDELAEEARESSSRLRREVERTRPLVPHAYSADALDRLEAQARAAARALEAALARVEAHRAQASAWKAEIARREAEATVAESQVRVAARAAEAAAIQVEKTRIRAPFRGLVIRKDAERGEVIAPTGGGQNSKGSVLTLVDPESFEMQVELNERRLGRVAEGQEASIRLDAQPDTAWPGVVRKIWPRADRAKGTVEVRVAFRQRPPLARPDMAGQVGFLSAAQGATDAATTATVTVPASAVLRRPAGDVVFVVREGVARSVRVTCGEVRDGQVVVQSGLAGGEVVVLDPDPSLGDGEPVSAGR
ncbi:MAG: efflux RND transporter periplasmic adaptor subunit [Planctomycetia bacterium]